MDKETRKLLTVITVAGLFIYFFRPKGKAVEPDLPASKKKSAKKYQTPRLISKKGETEEEQFRNAVISIKAYRRALNDRANEEDLKDLNRETIKDYGVRVILNNSTKLLTATDLRGNKIACENK